MVEKERQEDLLNKMRNVRDIAEKEIFDEQSAKQSTQSRSIQNITYLGKFEINEKEEELFMLHEDIEGKMNYKVVDENGKKIAIKLEQGFVFFRELSVDKMDELQKTFLDKVPEKDLNEMEKSELDKIAKEIGIEEKNINKMTEMELEETNEIDKEEIKDIRSLQEIKTNVKVDERHQLTQMLNLEKINKKPESKFVKIDTVYSDSLSKTDGEKQNSTKYSFVAIREDGSAQRIDEILEVDNAFGNINNEETMKFDADETARKDISTTSRFKIKGTNETLSVENGQYGELKLYYGGKAKGSNEIVETQLETRSIRPTSREVRDTQSQYKGIENKNEQLKEANEHFEKGEEKTSIENADGDINNSEELILSNGTKTTFEEEARKINCSVQTLKRVYEETEGRTVEERLEEAKDITQDIEAEEMGAPTRNRH